MANQPQQPDTALHNASHLMQYHDPVSYTHLDVYKRQGLMVWVLEMPSSAQW